jgi:large subunit ribosomal protein L17
MRHQNRVKKIGSSKAHRTSLMRNLAMNVIIHEKVKTTEAKAKAITPFVDKLINVGKKGEKDKVHAIRELNRLVNHESCSRKIMEQLVTKYKDRSSGYTRTTKAGFRSGDSAPMVIIELT